jgi:hypothetical protein
MRYLEFNYDHDCTEICLHYCCAIANAATCQLPSSLLMSSVDINVVTTLKKLRGIVPHLVM